MLKKTRLKYFYLHCLLLIFFILPTTSYAEDPYSSPAYLEFINCSQQCPEQTVEELNNPSSPFQVCYEKCKADFPAGWQIHKDRILNNANLDLEIVGSKDQTASEGNGSAKPIILNVPIAGMTQVASFGEYFQTWYSFAIGAVGVLATVMIMWGGFKWLTSRGNSGTISESKQIIWSALTGLVLAFLSYTILYLINPRLTTIELPTLKTATINADESHEKCGEVTLSADGKKTISNPCGEKEGTYGKDEKQNRGALTASGARIQTDSVDMANINNETIDKIKLLATDAPPGSVLITSGYRGGTANHGRGDTIDIKNSGDIDPFITNILGNTQGTPNNDEGFEMIIYQAPTNKYGITRIIDERKKPGESHWHIEF